MGVVTPRFPPDNFSAGGSRSFFFFWHFFFFATLKGQPSGNFEIRVRSFPGEITLTFNDKKNLQGWNKQKLELGRT